MMLSYNRRNNCTVLFALMEGGVVASYEIEHNYTPSAFDSYPNFNQAMGFNADSDEYHNDETIYH